MVKPKIGLDWDDVTAPFNSLAIDMANKAYHLDLTLEDITSWENTGKASVIKEFYNDIRLYESQKVNALTKINIRKLMKIADVYFITAVAPEFMGVRAKQIMDEFPEFPRENIILGSAKNLVQFDIILDDAIHNVLESPATYPVLMRKPWNRKMTGFLSVNTMEEFVLLVEQIIQSSLSKPDNVEIPSVIALVGPSGSGKEKIVKELCKDSRFVSPLTYCTKQSSKHKYLTEEEFNKQNFFEKTRYAGIQYGTKKEDIEDVLNDCKFAIMPLDMCGAITMKRHFPTAIIYINKDKESLILDIVEDNELSSEEKTLRLLSIDTERRNKKICDYIIENNDNLTAEKILKLIKND